ncbi:MAG: UDP-N-acetylmuramoyl-L-alanyl-D-glutamate--2,6-diaminopimelate ligase [Bacteroides sp.]|nr:UDP-N-acetylmuramoyl-L-alanyl-D-glutamate--2,6-diaminopimelate ligase [Eubacterium sp.]MCM1418327.1 UDP-N-acetylmuramoyl-L-alanyl-D-glutamate--2,6-diaminopimelate ligase [Roseburia sp.]MCM1463392.1 UDP-N-acetylmuramoyl-L-alanyl-D-glutamate--2,6-diaminopimelate ligase [Bacteroides sp.]
MLRPAWGSRGSKGGVETAQSVPDGTPSQKNKKKQIGTKQRKGGGSMRLYDIVAEEERGDCPDGEIGSITDDTRALRKNDVFIAITGKNFDGHAACAEMIEKGAAAVVVERDLGLSRQIVVKNTRKFYTTLASRYYGEPTKRLKLIAVTGTNGKTTTASMIRRLLNAAGRPSGYIGTAEYDVYGKIYPTRLTTPYQPELYRLFREMADNGAQYCVMEASSQALSQYRVYGERFVCGVFTNLTQDHLDWHGTMENYYKAKRSLFYACESAVIFTDDPYGARLYKELSASGGGEGRDRPARLVSVSTTEPADLFSVNIKLRAGGSSYWLCSREDEQSYPIELPSPGRFNVENSLCAAAACRAAGMTIRETAEAFRAVTGVRGRAEVLYDGAYTVICDYAHTADALEKILSAMKGFTKGKMIVVFGAAGERDAGKRKDMGATVARYADLAVVTSDNPRFESPERIIEMVMEGFADALCEAVPITDRREAIEYAVARAEAGDVLLLCGKGHEDYQVIGDDYRPFSEREVIAELCGGS